jgi:hypothetical protein
MSMPRICQQDQNGRTSQDILMYVMFNAGSAPLITALINESMKNISEEFPTDGVKSALISLIPPPSNTSLASLRVRFFLLLNQDSRMRRRLCESKIAWYIPTLCPFKACNLFDQLRTTLIPNWIKDETVDLLAFEEKLRDEYLVA